MDVDWNIIQDKIKGVIFGAAIGDAVGLATEFMKKQEAFQLYGNGPIKFGKGKGFEFWRDFHRRRWHENDFTDDTDQLLLVTQCLLEDDCDLIPQHFAFRLKEWVDIGFPELDGKMACGLGSTVGSCISAADFVTNPHKVAYDVWDKNGRNLAANGAVMRTSVLGIPFFWDEQKVVKNAINCAKVTHADPRSVFSSVVISVTISRLLRTGLGQVPLKSSPDVPMCIALLEMGSNKTNTGVIPIPDPISKATYSKKETTLWDKIKRVFQSRNPNLPSGWPNHNDPDEERLETPRCTKMERAIDNFHLDEEFNSIVQEVVGDYKFLLMESAVLCKPETRDKWIQDMEYYCCKLSALSLEDLHLDKPNSIGYTLKCLGAGLLALTRQIPKERTPAKFFKSIITDLALEAGDADTNCTVAGALLGARLGYSGLPLKWRTGIRHGYFLVAISDELATLVKEKYSPTL